MSSLLKMVPVHIIKSLKFMGNIIELNKSKRKNHERLKDVHQR